MHPYDRRSDIPLFQAGLSLASLAVPVSHAAQEPALLPRIIGTSLPDIGQMFAGITIDALDIGIPNHSFDGAGPQLRPELIP